MKKVREALRLHIGMNLSVRQAHRAAGVPRTTIQDYIRRFKSSAMTIDEVEGMSDNVLHSRLFPEQRSATPSKKPLPDMLYLHNELKQRKQTKVTLMLLWEEYKEQYPDGYEYTQFRVLYKKHVEKLNPSMRQVHLGGEKVFVDYSGLTMPIYDIQTGEIVKCQVFIAVLGASGYTFAHATPSQKQEDFFQAHVLAYRYFEGVPRIVVSDNLKSAVITHSNGEIVINEGYADLARHYNMAIEPARPYKPKDKPKVEQGVQGIQRYILARFRHRKFYSVDELNESIGPLLDDYNNKIVKHLEQSRTQMFETLDKPHLKPLPANRYSYKEFKVARVNQDYHITLDKCNYSVPYGYLKELVDVHYNSHSVKIYHNNTLIATHPRLRRTGDVSTLKEHMPSSHQYVHEKMNPDRLRNWAKNIGSNASAFVEARFAAAEYEATAYRPIIAVLSLAKLHGKSELELALMFALEKQTLKTKSIKSILEKKLYPGRSANNIMTTPPILNTHDNLRNAQEYQ
ncbi:MAG: IS21 family transposase [Sulfuricurvum sp.]|jgi:transposase|uniref:IS21 family transposase n=1 Tax=Sulfuricurvum sp. TaxID=2025608 RepID=UPI0025CC35FC|nr:IS21 family transposase [Sulfuricurvum sp.]MCK9373698.1 IS21 family transposase [Sulfuricurvum sp.]